MVDVTADPIDIDATLRPLPSTFPPSPRSPGRRRRFGAAPAPGVGDR